MVIHTQTMGSAILRRRTRGMLEIDMVVAIAIFAIAILPVGYSFSKERKVLRIEYYRSVAMEIVDGEMEILLAGEAKSQPEGVHLYPVQSNAAAALPEGDFQLTKKGTHLKLEWNARKKFGIGTVVREVDLK